MATVTQIYGIVNDAASEAFGASAITVKDTTSFASLGNTVLSSESSIDVFYKKLVDRIGRTVIAMREYNPKKRKVMKNDLEWGFALQKISYKMKEANNNPTWTSETQASPYDIEPQTTVVQKIFSVMSAYDFSDSIPTVQMFTAFTSPEAMGAFIAGIYTNQDNMLKVAEENLANLAVNTNIAIALKSTNEKQKRNLLAEFNEKTGAGLTKANCLSNLEFLKYATQEIMLTTKHMENMGVTFNDGEVPRHTPKDRQVVEVLAEFAAAQAAYLQADTYHKELVTLPAYEEVSYWQAPGTDYEFANTSKIFIQNANIDANNPVEQDGIIAFIHDVDSCGSIITKYREGSLYNGYAERMNIWAHAEKGFYCDSTENAVVFYVA